MSRNNEWGEEREGDIPAAGHSLHTSPARSSAETAEHYDRVQTTSGLHLKAVNMQNAVRLCLCFRFIIEMNGGQMFTNCRHDLLSWAQS